MRCCAFLFCFFFFYSQAGALSAIPQKKGVEVRVCGDRDCLTDGSLEAREIVDALAKRASGPLTVTKCGCLGPCGKGPNVDVRVDGIRVKDNRPGKDNYYIWRGINSAESAAAMFRAAGISITDNSIDNLSDKVVVSSRKFWDLDRTTRIALQRLLYISVALPLLDADQKGTWDMINGEIYPNSYAAFAFAVFVASQFMGTDSKANAVDGTDE